MTMIWKKPNVHGTAPSPRAGHTSKLVFSKQLLVFGGGYLNKVYNDLHVFDVGMYYYIYMYVCVCVCMCVCVCVCM